MAGSPSTSCEWSLRNNVPKAAWTLTPLARGPREALRGRTSTPHLSGISEPELPALGPLSAGTGFLFWSPVQPCQVRLGMRPSGKTKPPGLGAHCCHPVGEKGGVGTWLPSWAPSAGCPHPCKWGQQD